MTTHKTTTDFSNYRVHYHPNTETLNEGELRVIALGTGSPTVRPSQVSAGWLIEIPSRTSDIPERFLFDIGTGCIVNYAALQIPFEETRKAFISHLHSDHWGDFISYWIGGLAQGRKSEIEIWGPDGETEELGSIYAINRIMDAMNWDVASRENNVPPTDTVVSEKSDYAVSEQIETDFRSYNANGLNVRMYQFPSMELMAIYEDRENDIVIKSWPADHALKGAVSFSLEWGDIKIVYSGDTKPLEDELYDFRQYFHGANLLIHECFNATDGHYDTDGGTLSDVTEDFNFHTTPEQFGELMEEYDPYHAVAYHFPNDFDTCLDIYNRIRKSYSGRLTLAKDLLAWNVTKDHVIARNVAIHPDTWTNDIFSK